MSENIVAHGDGLVARDGGRGEPFAEELGDGGELLHEFGEGFREQGLRSVAHGFGGVVVVFDHDAVSALAAMAGAGEGGDELAVSGGV